MIIYDNNYLLEITEIAPIICRWGSDAGVKRVHLVSTINQHIDELNQKIRNYNNITKNAYLMSNNNSNHIILKYIQFRKIKIDALQQIQVKFQEMDNKYIDDIIKSLPDYHHKIYLELFTSLKQQRAYLNINSRFQSLPLQEQIEVTLPAIIDNMAPDKFSLMLFLLDQNNLSELATLYDGDGESNECQQFQQFLDTHTIETLSWRNSKIFHVKNKNNNTSLIMKLEHQFYPKCFEQELRNKLKKEPANDFFTPIFTSRRANYKRYGLDRTKTLSITAYCIHGHLLTHAASCLDRDRDANIMMAIDMGIALGKIIKDIQDLGFLSTDLKPKNILVDYDPVCNKNILKISDAKSYLPQSSKGVLSRRGAWVCRTKKFVGPELQRNNLNSNKSGKIINRSVISVDKLHAYFFGRIVYEYLTKFDRKLYELYRALISCNYPFGIFGYFNSDIFRNDKGQALQKWIQALSKEDPSARTSIEEAVDQLLIIKQGELLFLREKCVKKLENIREFQFTNPSFIKPFLDTMFNEIYKESCTESDMRDILVNIDTELNLLTSSPIIKTDKEKYESAKKSLDDLINELEESELTILKTNLDQLLDHEREDDTIKLDVLCEQINAKVRERNSIRMALKMRCWRLLDEMLSLNNMSSKTETEKYVYETDIQIDKSYSSHEFQQLLHIESTLKSKSSNPTSKFSTPIIHAGFFNVNSSSSPEIEFTQPAIGFNTSNKEHRI